MDFRLLGPLEVTERGRSVALGGPKQRSVLALLLLHANETVSLDRIGAALWGDRAPPTATKSIQVHVSRLRKDLGADRLATRAPGYVLHVGPDELDLARFRDLLAAARDGRPADAAEMLRDALALWRGDAAGRPRLRAVRPAAHRPAGGAAARRPRGAHRRRPRRRAARRARRRARRARRRASAARAAARQLMLALYRSGRQSDALDAYRAAYRTSPRSWGWSRAPSCRRSSGPSCSTTRVFSPRRHRSSPRTTPARADPSWSSRSRSIVPMRCSSSPCRSHAPRPPARS